MPCASNQCSSARRTLPSSRRTRPIPFSFRQRPRPKRLTSIFRMRTPFPVAIGSMFVISSTFSNCTANYGAHSDAVQRSTAPWITQTQTEARLEYLGPGQGRQDEDQQQCCRWISSGSAVMDARRYRQNSKHTTSAAAPNLNALVQPRLSRTHSQRTKESVRRPTLLRTFDPGLETRHRTASRRE